MTSSSLPSQRMWSTNRGALRRGREHDGVHQFTHASRIVRRTGFASAQLDGHRGGGLGFLRQRDTCLLKDTVGCGSPSVIVTLTAAGLGDTPFALARRVMVKLVSTQSPSPPGSMMTSLTTPFAS